MKVRIYATVKTTEVREYEVELGEVPGPEKAELIAETMFDSGRPYKVVRTSGPRVDRAHVYLGA